MKITNTGGDGFSTTNIYKNPKKSTILGSKKRNWKGKEATKPERISVNEQVQNKYQHRKSTSTIYTQRSDIQDKKGFMKTWSTYTS